MPERAARRPPRRPGRPATTAAAPSRRLSALRRAQQRTSSSAGPVDPASPASPVRPGGSAGTEPAGGRPSRAAVWRRVRRSVSNPGRGQLIAAVLLFVLGMAGVVQIRVNGADDTYSTARREDLVQLLDGLGSESRRLEGEIGDLERTRGELQSGADTEKVAREEAEQRVAELGILAGTAPAQGPGIRLRITDPAGKVDADVLLDAVEEMRDAGAEVIEIDDSVRVVASTWFGSDAAGLLVDGEQVDRPLTLEVIGDPHSLEEAARFRGGIVSEITGPTIGGSVQIEQEDRIVVQSLHTVTDPDYARPSSPPATPR